MRSRPRGADIALSLLIAILAVAVVGIWLGGALLFKVRELATASLSTALRRDVIIGRVSGDPWRLVLEDVRLPATRPGDPDHLAARRITLHFNVPGIVRDLVGGRGLSDSILGRISDVVIDGPMVTLLRRRGGDWSLADLVRGAGGAGRPPAFTGRIILLDGTMTLIDRARIAPRVFEVRAVDLNGQVDFARSPRVTFTAAFVEERERRRAPGRLAGTYLLNDRVLNLSLRASELNVSAWGPYVLTSPTFRPSGGRVDADVHILRAPGAPGFTTDVSGRLVVRDGRAEFRGRPARLSGVQGEIRVSGRAISTPGLRGILNGVRVEVRGDATFYGEPRLDLAVRSASADLTAVGRLFFPGLVSRISGTAAGDLRIRGPLRALRVDGRVEVSNGVMERQRVQHAAADLAIYGNTLSLTRASGLVEGAPVSGSMLWSLGRPEFYISLEADGIEASAVTQMFPSALPPATGRLRGSVVAVRGGAGVDLVGRAMLSGGHLQGVTFDDARGFFRKDSQGIAIEHVQVRRGSSQVVASGRVAAGGGLALRVLGSTRDPAALPIPQIPRDLGGRVDFDGRLDGTIRAPALTGFLQLTEGRIGDLTVNSASGRLALQRGRVALSDGQIRSGYASVRVSGLAETAGRGVLSIDAEAERIPVQTIGRVLAVSLPLAGTAGARLRIGGSPERPLVGGSLSVRDARVLGRTVDEAAAAVRWDGARLSVVDGWARLGRSIITLGGAYDRTGDLAFAFASSGLDLEDVNLRALGPARVSGPVDVTGQITGPITAPVVNVEAASSRLTINYRRFDEVRGSFRWAGRTLHVEPLALRTGGERYRVRGAFDFTAQPHVSLEADMAGGRLSTLLSLGGVRLGTPLDGVIDGASTVDGPLANPSARLHLTMTSGQLGEYPLAGHADVTLRDGGVNVQETEFSLGRGRLAAFGHFEPAGQSEAELNGSDLDLDVLRPLFKLTRPLSGRFSFAAQFSGTMAAPQFGVDLQVTGGGIGAATVESVIASAFYRSGRLELVNGLLAQGGYKVRVAGSIPLDVKSFRLDPSAPLDVRLSLVDADLGLLKAFSTRFQEARGALQGGVTVAGTVSAPYLTGGLRITDGFLLLRGMKTPVESLALDLRLDDTGIRVTQGTARIGGGNARLDGALRLVLAGDAGMTLEIPPDTPLVFQGAGMRVLALPWVDVKADATLRLLGAIGDPRRPLTADGQVVLSEGTLALVAPAGGGESGSAFPLAFGGLRLTVGRDLKVLIGGNRIALEPEGAVTVTGTLSAPMLDGTIAAQRGAVSVMGITFDLQEGEVTFRPGKGVTPQVNARAVTRASTRPSVGAPVNALITVTVQGAAPDSLVVSLRSDPVLPISEILAALGLQPSLAEGRPGDLGAALQAELGRRLLSIITPEITRVLGLSQLTVDYRPDRPLRLTAGAALLPNLYVMAAASFDLRTTWSWGFEYRFLPGWTFSMTSDEDRELRVIFLHTRRY